jgi:hypothetical protein
MLKTAIFGSPKDQEAIKNTLIPFFEGNNISFEFHDASNSIKFMNTYLFNNTFKIIITCLRDKTSYIIKSYGNHNVSRFIFGSMSFPPTLEEINKNLFKNHDLSSTCPYKEYIIKKHNKSRKILHEDIEYLQAEKNKTIIHLKNGDTETISKHMGKVANELNINYFVKCCSGYMVNIYNMNKIYKVSKYSYKLELKSGEKIPVSYKNIDEFYKILSLSSSKNNTFNSITVLDE